MKILLAQEPLSVKEILQLPDQTIQIYYSGSGDYLNNLIEDINFSDEAVEVSVKVVAFSEEEVMVEGYFEGSVILSCERCIEEFLFDVKEHFSANFVAAPYREDKDQELTPAQTDELPIISGKIDILSLIRDEILLGLPMRALCRRDCKGLCPYCGKNLNKEPCTCKKQTYSPLSKLESILKLSSKDLDGSTKTSDIKSKKGKKKGTP